MDTREMDTREMDTREMKGREIADRMRIEQSADPAIWIVPSQKSQAKYQVDPDKPSCNCEDFTVNRKPCKHIRAVRFKRDYQRGVEPPPPPPRSDTPPFAKRKTYRQNWPAYVQAQMQEKHRFLVLLHELSQTVAEPMRRKPGRPPIPMPDVIIIMALKVWLGLSARRINCDVLDAVERGHLSRWMHPHMISSFFLDEALTPVLKRLVVTSSLPMAVCENAFAVDSSGFSSSKFLRWFDVRSGKVRAWHDVIKLQMMCGTRTNVITAVEICDQDGNDAPYLRGLVETTAEHFRIKEVSADKGYSSVDAHEAIAAVGGESFIPFKTVATGYSGGIWEQMFHFFQLHREEFLKHYHLRSNVETTFFMLKRKFGDNLRSRTKTAMVNELLTKVICHNISVTIHEQLELGIVPHYTAPDRDGGA